MSEQDWKLVRRRVREFVLTVVEPMEPRLDAATHAERRPLVRQLMQQAKDAGLWAIGHPREIGGQGMPFLEYVHVNEEIGRSFHAMQALGTLSLQDSLMLSRYASPAQRERYLAQLVAGDFAPSFGVTEPAVASSDPTQLRTTAHLEGDHWVINGRKWFTTGAADAAYTTVMCRTDESAKPHDRFSMIIVPTDTPGYRIVRETPVLGIEGGHYEVDLSEVRVPRDNLLGPAGHGFRIAQQRLGPGRIFHCMRWLGQAQRAFDLMCRRMYAREAFGGLLADKQLLQSYVFESAAEIQASRLLTLDAARQLDAGKEAREQIALIKVAGARMLHNVVDRAMQVHGAMGLTPDSPLDRMYRHAREARIYDGPDEVHINSVARRLLKAYRDDGPGIEFETLSPRPA
jgi:alkylation response protein AidB-like acyl-CoA dehydrogenase